MEEPQREIINGVRYSLVCNMRCNTMLLAKLMQDGLITDFEDEFIRSKNINAERCTGLLEILFGKQNAFLKLYEALVEEKQSGASKVIFKATKLKIPKNFEQMVKINEKHEFSPDEIYFHSCPTSIFEFVSSNNINTIIVTTINSDLTIKKIKDTVSKVHVKTKKLSETPSGMITLWTQPTEIEKLIEKVAKTNDKHIIVINHTFEMINKLTEILCKTKTVLLYTDTFRWKDLAGDFRIQIYSHKVRFLNKLLTLEEFCEEHKIEEDSLENLDEQFLIQLINNEVPSILRNTIPLKLKYYVARTIQTRCMLSLHKIEEFAYDFFLISGMEQTEMASQFTRMTNTASSQISQKALTVHYILLELESQFDHICELTPNAVHWIHHVDKQTHRFMWVKSRGDITSIQKMIHLNQEAVSETEFPDKLFRNKYITNFCSPVCIVDSPGMGKTELLANIGRSLETEFPNQLVVFVRAPDFTSKVKERLPAGLQVTLQVLTECITQIVCNSGLVTKAMFQNCLKTGLKINLLLDGYDEIPFTNIKLAEDILKHLSNNDSSVRAFISSRAENLEFLENAISVLAYKILPFSKKEQHQFLISYWNQAFINNSFSFDVTRLKHFTSQCLENVEEQIPKSDREFAGIPLQCLLIGIVFQNSCWEYAKSGNQFSKCALNIGVLSVSDLFKKCFGQKFQDAVQKHKLEDFNENECMYAHACHAIKLIFPAFPTKIPTEAKELFKFGILEQTTQTGEIQQFLHRTFAEYLVSWVAVAQLKSESHKYISSDDAKLLLKNLFETSEICREHIFYGQVNFDFVNWMCLYFVNQKCGELQSCSQSIIEIKGIKFDHGVRFMALACARHDFPHLLRFFIKTQHRHLRQSQLLESLLVASVNFATLPLIRLVCDYFDEIMSTSKTKYGLRHISVEYYRGSVITLLHIAVKRGQYDVVEYLCKEKGFENLVKNMRIHRLAQTLARNTINDEYNNIEQKLKILEYLCNLNSYVLTESNNDNQYTKYTFTYNTHPKIVRRYVHLMQQHSHFVSPVLLVYVLLNDEDMIKLETSVRYHSTSFPYLNSKGKDLAILKSVFLDLLSLEVKCPQKFLTTVSAFMDLNSIFDMNDANFFYSLRNLSQTTNVKYMRKLQGHGVNFGVIFAKRQNLLHMLSTQASVPFLRFMIEAGVSVTLRDKVGNTPLHNILEQKRCNESIINTLIEEMIRDSDDGNGHDCWESLLETAVKHGHSLAVSALLEKVSSNVNCNESLYHAMINWEHNTAKQTEIVDTLLKYGADIKYITENMNLHQTINSGGVDITFPILERLVSLGLEFSGVTATKTLVKSIEDKANYDSKYKLRLFRCLLQIGADVNVVDEQGNTLLHKATQLGQLDYVRMLIDNGLSANCLNSFKQTPLHFYIEDISKQLPILEILVAAGGDLCAQSTNQIAFFEQISSLSNYDFTFSIIKFLLPAILNLKLDKLSSNESLKLAEIMMAAINLGIKLPETIVRAQNLFILHACAKSRPGYVKTLLTERLLVNIQDQDGNTPLHLALLHQTTNTNAIKSLVKAGADLNIRNKLGHIPVEYFRFEHNSCSYTKTLMFLGIENLKNVPKFIVQKCLKHIQKNKGARAFSFLSTMAIGGINILAHVETNFIFDCSKENAFSLIRCLHSLGCDITTRDNEGNTILHLSLLGKASTPQSFHYLLDYAVVSGNDKLLAVRNKANKTPLICAVEKFDVLKCSLDRFHETGRNFDFEDDNQMPVIVTAVKYGRSLEFINLLQSYGCSLKPLIKGKWRYLGHEMVKNGRLTNLQTLFDIGYNVNTRDENGDILLHAALTGNTGNVSAAVDLLLENFADINAKNNDGLVPFDMIAASVQQHFGVEYEQCSEKIDEKNQPNHATSLETIMQKTETAVFESIVCTGCKTCPIQGIWYKCLLCENYDLCHDCTNRNMHSNHVLTGVCSKQQYDSILRFHSLNFQRIAAGWKYFYGASTQPKLNLPMMFLLELPKHVSKKVSWKMTCSCCDKKENVERLFMCMRCSYDQCESCWKSYENTHLMVILFTEKQYDTFSKLFRRTK